MTGGRRVVLHGDHTDGCGAPRLREGHTPGLLFAFRAGPGKLREGKQKATPQDFSLLSVLGQGSFGKVRINACKIMGRNTYKIVLRTGTNSIRFWTHPDRRFCKIWSHRSFVGYQSTKKPVEVLKHVFHHNTWLPLSKNCMQNCLGKRINSMIISLKNVCKNSL